MNLYTPTSPTRQGDRIRLFSSPDAAWAAVGDLSLFPVAVRVEEMGRLVVPIRTNSQTFDPGWTAPSYVETDGSISARAPFPDVLFVEALLGRSGVIATPEEGKTS